MRITSYPPRAVLTSSDGILIGTSSGTQLLTGGTEGQVPTVQGDGTIAFADTVGGITSVEELDEWSTNTLTIPGTLIVQQNGGVAGTDEIQISHDGSNAAIVAQAGEIHFTSAGAEGPKITAAGEFSSSVGHINTESFGVGANTSDARSAAFGRNATTTGDQRCTSIGHDSTAAGPHGTALGQAANANKGTALGSGSTAGDKTVAVGIGVTATGPDGSIVIGDSVSSHNQSISLMASTTGSNQFVTGFIDDVYIGRGVTSANPHDITYHATGGSGTDIAGANLILAGGISTGAGTPGEVQIKVAPAGVSGSSANTLETVAEFDADTIAGNTRLLIYDVDNGQLERVSVGSADSGGTGYKLLRIPN